MTTSGEIEIAAESLPAVRNQELLLFLAGRLRAEGPPLPGPRTFPAEQVAAWIAEDEADAARLDGAAGGWSENGPRRRRAKFAGCPA